MMTRILIGMMLLCVGLGCGDESKECSDLESGTEQDTCLKEEIQKMDASQLEAVGTQARQISDPMIRSYAVSTWVKDHSNEISLEQGTGLCELLEGREESYCLRRLSSPHLQR